jgi:hypothetical protein
VDGAGNFAIHGLIPGEFRLLFRDQVPGPEQTETGNFPYGWMGPNHTLVAREDDGASVDVSGADVNVGTVAIPRGTDIVGQVTDGKKGLAGAYLFVCDAAGDIGCASANGAADGSFRIVHVPSASYTIFVSVPDRVIGYYQPAGFTVDDFAGGTVKVVSGGPDVKGVKVAVPAGSSVSGRITGPSGEAVVGATLSVSPFGIPPNWHEPISGADGTYRQLGIPTNEYRLSVRAPAGSNYLSGYYAAGQPGHFTEDFDQATVFRVVESDDRVAPTITFRDPAMGATDVSPQQDLSIRFSEPVDNVTTSTITLKDARGRIVPTTVSFMPNDRTARLTPVDSLQPGAKYKLTLSSAIVDWSGNHFAGASWSFTTSP